MCKINKICINVLHIYLSENVIISCTTLDGVFIICYLILLNNNLKNEK